MKHVVIHAGFLKIATTALQTLVFPNIEEFSYYNPLRHTGHADIANDPVACSLLSLSQESSHTFRPATAKLLFESFSNDARDRIVVSNEGVTSFTNDVGIVADRLRMVFGDAAILFVLRNQFDLMRSFQKQNGAKTHLVPHHLDKVDWGQWLWHQMLEGHCHTNMIRMLDFDSVIGYYERIFGPENIHILLFEELQKDALTFCGRFADVLRCSDGATLNGLLRGKSVNRGPSIARRRIHRLVPHRLMSVKDPQEFGSYEERLNGIFGRSNMRLAERYRLPLAEYGYPIAANSLDLNASRAQG